MDNLMSLILGLNFGNSFANAVQLATVQGWITFVFATILVVLWFTRQYKEMKKRKKLRK